METAHYFVQYSFYEMVWNMEKCELLMERIIKNHIYLNIIFNYLFERIYITVQKFQ